MNRNGWVLLATVAIFASLILLIIKSGDADCQRYETREVEMTHQGKLDSGVRKHQYKVCVQP